MTCRHQAGDPACGSSHVDPYHEASSSPATPDVEQYTIEDAVRVGPHLVLRVKYPNCRSCAYEGNKVLVLLNVTEAKALRWKRIDPHSRNTKPNAELEAPSPAAEISGQLGRLAGRARLREQEGEGHPMSTKTKATAPARYSFCESTAAGSRSPWHIREVPVGEEPKLGGGITTNSLCGRVARGWDLEVVIDEHHLGHAHSECVTEYRKRIYKLGWLFEVTRAGPDAWVIMRPGAVYAMGPPGAWHRGAWRPEGEVLPPGWTDLFPEAMARELRQLLRERAAMAEPDAPQPNTHDELLIELAKAALDVPLEGLSKATGVSARVLRARQGRLSAAARRAIRDAILRAA
jgi:hypothetical protein